MRKDIRFHTGFLLAIMALSLQSCLGFGGNDQFQNTNTGKNGGQIGINKTVQALFKGKIYFTLNRNLYVLDGNRNLTQLTHDIDVRDPAISPDGKWIAFISRHANYSDLVYMPINGGPVHSVITGNGHYVPQGEGYNDFYWFAQPAWSTDSARLLFLSDLHKIFYWSRLGGVFANAFFLDMQVFSIPFNGPTLTAKQALAQKAVKPVGYANFGDGGNRDPSYRPNHPGQVIYTHYTYDTTQTKQVVQLYLVDEKLMQTPHYPAYHPGVVVGTNLDPAVALTPEDADTRNIQPAFSPDGSALAYLQTTPASNQMGLYILQVPDDVTATPGNPDTQKKALLPYQNASLMLKQQFLGQPTWSPDGKQIAYLSYNNNLFDIWLLDINKDPKTGVYSIKGNPIQLTNTNDQLHLDGDSRPVWAP